MTREAVKRVLGAQPFKPFQLRLTDGALVPVAHPEFIALSETGRTAVVMTHGDDFKIVDMALVTALQFDGLGKSG